GTAFTFLHHHMGAAPGVFRGRGLVRGGAGRLAAAFEQAARAAGAEIRLGAAAASIRLDGSRVGGVVLGGGEEIAARTVLSAGDARATLLGLLPAGTLEPEFARALTNIKFRGA